MQGVAVAQGGVGVGHAEVGVDAEPEDEQGAAGVVEDLDDAVVVGHGNPLPDGPPAVRQASRGGRKGNRMRVN